MTRRMIIVGLCAAVLLAIGSSPRYLEELRIGGGYGDPVDGGTDIDKSGNISTDGSIEVGTNSSERGVVTLWDGAGNIAPGCMKLGSANGTVGYLFMSNDRTGLRLHSALPTSDSDGSWPTAGRFRGSGSTTDAVDLDTAEVAGVLLASHVGNGLTDTQVSDALTLSGGVINNTPIGAATASSGRFTSLAATGNVLVDGGNIGLTADTDLLGLSSGRLAIRGSLAAEGGAISAGSDDVNVGILTLYGDDENVGAAITLHNSANYDALVDSWTIASGMFGGFLLLGSGGTNDPGVVAYVMPTDNTLIYEYDVHIEGGDLQVGANETRGTISVQNGPDAPGCFEFASTSGASSYVFASNDGAGLRICNTLPTSDTDGNWLAASKFRGSGSTTDAVDLATPEVAGVLPASKMAGNLTISGGAIDNTAIGATTASTGKFTTLTATGAFSATTITTFTADDTTPSVSAGNVFKVPITWSFGHDITMFDDGAVGQQIVLFGGDSDCTVVDGGYLKLSMNWVAVTNSTLCLIFDGTNWYETSRSPN